MLKIMNIDGQTIGMTAHDNDLEYLVNDCLKDLVEKEKVFMEDYENENALEILLDNGCILNKNGVLTGNENTLKWYFSRLI